MAISALIINPIEVSTEHRAGSWFSDERGATLIEYTVATVILVLGLVFGILVFEVALTGKINQGRCTYTDYNLPDPRSSGSASSC